MKSPETNIALVPLDNTEYADFAERQVAECARQYVNAGEWTSEESLRRSRETQADLLSDVLRSAGHVFFKGIDDDGTRVGWLWVGPAPEFLGEARECKRWLHQITVEETLRHRGYGRALLAALHRWLEQPGIEELWLRVYDWSEAARRLYAGAGYEVMRKFPTDAHLRRRIAKSLTKSDREKA